MNDFLSETFTTPKTHTCGNCGKKHDYPAAMQIEVFVCPDCRLIFDKKNGNWAQGNTNPTWEQHPLNLGMQAVFDGEGYTVAGIADLNMPGGDFYSSWSEYVLFGDRGSRAFLSETNGHWVFLKEMEERITVSDKSQYFVLHRNKKFDTFKKIYKYDIICEGAVGFFDYPLFEKSHAEEGILVPEHIVSEKRGADKDFFLGHYVTPKEMQAAFQEDLALPDRLGVGASQPFYLNAQFYAIVVLTGFAMFLFNIITNISNTQKTLAQHTVDMQDSTWHHRVVTPSFGIEGSTSPVDIFLSSPSLMNNWVSFEVWLVNEKTKESFYTEVGIERYSGTDGYGEAWEEGKISDHFTLCSVPPGTYNAAFKPSKSSDKVSVATISLSRGNAYMANSLTCLVASLVICLIVYIIQASFDQKRWQDSDFGNISQ
jgi:hypothetical protein